MDIKETASLMGIIGAVLGGIRYVWLYLHKKIVKPFRDYNKRFDAVERNSANISINAEFIDYVNKKSDALIRLLPYPLFVTDGAGLCILANNALCELFMAEESQIKGYGWINCIIEEDREKAWKGWETAFKNKSDDVKLSYRIMHDDTQEIVRCTYHAIISRDHEDKVIVSVGKVDKHFKNEK